MQKKTVQISSTTLGLRFMQHAKIRQERRETEVAQAKVVNEEQWHLATGEWETPSSNSHHADRNQNVLYESSYLPFLFPGSKPSAQPVDEDSESREKPGPELKGRRTFGKHGKEENIPTLPGPEEQSDEPQDANSTLPRHSPPHISASLSEPSSGPPNEPKVVFLSKRKEGPNTFLRPNVEAPKTTKRIFDDTSETARKRKKKKPEH